MRLLGLSCLVAMFAACSGNSSNSTSPHPDGSLGNAMPDASDAAQGDAGATRDAGAGPAGNPACSVAMLAEPELATTYYVAIGEPGADNERCDGLSPVDAGAGRCPFKDLSSARTRGLLDGAKGVRVELREGTYVIAGWDGMQIRGTGGSASERVVLSAFPGEHPVLDVPAPDGAGCTEQSAPQNPDCVRQVLNVTGTHTLVQGLTIQNGLGYHVAIVSGAHHVFRCNTLHETVAFEMRSDCLKIAGETADVQVLHNDFSRFRSQAVDVTQATDVLIEDNEFHAPIDDDAGATGTKFGARRVTIRGNRIHDFGSSPQMHAFSLGGTGSDHPDDQEAYEVHVVGNRVWNIAGLVAQVVSCVGCSVTDNQVSGAGAGVLVSSAGTGGSDCTTAADGCGSNRDTRITGNRMRDLHGGGDPKQADTFVAVDEGEGAGLRVDDNVYCATAAAGPSFLFAGERLSLDAWRARTLLDEGSRAPAPDDAECTW